MSKLPKTKCPTTHKRVYKTRQHAMDALIQIALYKANSFSRAEARCYKCEYCPGWHLTKAV